MNQQEGRNERKNERNRKREHKDTRGEIERAREVKELEHGTGFGTTHLQSPKEETWVVSLRPRSPPQCMGWLPSPTPTLLTSSPPFLFKHIHLLLNDSGPPRGPGDTRDRSVFIHTPTHNLSMYKETKHT